MKKLNENEIVLFRIKERRWFRSNLREERKRRRLSIAGMGKSYHSVPLDMLAEGIRAPRCKNGDVLISMPSNLSLIANPEGVLKVVKALSASTRSKKTKNVILDYAAVENLDLAAECLLSIVAMEAKREDKNRRKKLNFKGRYPKSASYIRLIRGIGVIKSLEIKRERLSSEEERGLRVFRYANMKKADEVGLDTADTNSRVSAGFVEHINSCLADHMRQLTTQSKMQLSEYTGEIIGNAEDHSGMFHWYIFGYLDNSEDKHTCEVVILNFGKSIADTFEELPVSHFAFHQVAPYIQQHLKAKLFNPSWTKEDLYTLIALQGNVSCKNESSTSTRGQGTVELIEFFQKVHKECTNGGGEGAQMTIVSGGSRIFIDGQYEMKADEKGRKRIAFNANNDLAESPDPSAVGNIGGMTFPGTIIAISFPMKMDHTETLEANEP